MMSVVRDEAPIAGSAHVRPAASSAQCLDTPPRAFELVAIGNAFAPRHASSSRPRRRGLAPSAATACQRSLKGIFELMKLRRALICAHSGTLGIHSCATVEAGLGPRRADPSCPAA